MNNYMKPRYANLSKRTYSRFGIEVKTPVTVKEVRALIVKEEKQDYFLAVVMIGALVAGIVCKLMIVGFFNN